MPSWRSPWNWAFVDGPVVVLLALPEDVAVDRRLRKVAARVVEADGLLVPLDEVLVAVVDDRKVLVLVRVRDPDQLDLRLLPAERHVGGVEVGGPRAVPGSAVEQDEPLPAHEVLPPHASRHGRVELPVDVEVLEDHLVPLERRVGMDDLAALVVEADVDLALVPDRRLAPDAGTEAVPEAVVFGGAVEVEAVVLRLRPDALLGTDLPGDLPRVRGRRGLGIFAPGGRRQDQRRAGQCGESIRHWSPRFLCPCSARGAAPPGCGALRRGSSTPCSRSAPRPRPAP